MSFQCAIFSCFACRAFSDLRTSVHDHCSRSEARDLEEGKSLPAAKGDGFLHACYPYLYGRGLHPPWKVFGCCILVVSLVPAIARHWKKCTHHRSGFGQHLLNILRPGGDYEPWDLYVSRHCRLITGFACLSRSQPISFSGRIRFFLRRVSSSPYFGVFTLRTGNPWKGIV